MNNQNQLLHLIPAAPKQEFYREEDGQVKPWTALPPGHPLSWTQDEKLNPPGAGHVVVDRRGFV